MKAVPGLHLDALQEDHCSTEASRQRRQQSTCKVVFSQEVSERQSVWFGVYLMPAFHNTLLFFFGKNKFFAGKNYGVKGFKFRQQIIPPAYCRFASLWLEFHLHFSLGLDLLEQMLEDATGENEYFARLGYSRDAIFSLLHGFDVSWSTGGVVFFNDGCFPFVDEPRIWENALWGHPKPLHSTGLHGCGIYVAWLKGSKWWPIVTTQHSRSHEMLYPPLKPT